MSLFNILAGAVIQAKNSIHLIHLQQASTAILYWLANIHELNFSQLAFSHVAFCHLVFCQLAVPCIEVPLIRTLSAIMLVI